MEFDPARVLSRPRFPQRAGEAAQSACVVPKGGRRLCHTQNPTPALLRQSEQTPGVVDVIIGEVEAELTLLPHRRYREKTSSQVRLVLDRRFRVALVTPAHYTN
jgi:hypothetical protein